MANVVTLAFTSGSHPLGNMVKLLFHGIFNDDFSYNSIPFSLGDEHFIMKQELAVGISWTRVKENRMKRGAEFCCEAAVCKMN